MLICAPVDFRIFAQSKNADIMSAGKHKGVAPDTPSFAKWCIENCLQGYPGVGGNRMHSCLELMHDQGTPAMDLRQSTGKPFFEYWATLFPQDRISHEVRTLEGKSIPVPPPARTQVYPRQQDSYDSAPMDINSWGETVEAPLGYIVHGRKVAPIRFVSRSNTRAEAATNQAIATLDSSRDMLMNTIGCAASSV